MFKKQFLRLKNDENFKSLLRDSGLLYIAGVFSIGLTFLQQISTANLLGSATYGQYATVLSGAVFLLLIIDIRTWELGAKLLAKPISEDNRHEIMLLTNWLSLFDIVLGCIGGILLFLLAQPIALYLLKEPDLAQLVRIYSIALPFKLYSAGVPVALVRMYNHFGWLSIKSVSFATVKLILIPGAALAGLGLPGVIAGIILAEIANSLFLFIIVVQIWRTNLIGTRFFQHGKLERLPEIMKMIPGYWFFGTLKSFQMETFIPLTALLSSPAQVGLLKVGLDIASLISNLISPISIVIAPNIIKSYEIGSRLLFIRNIKQSAMLLSVLTIPFTLTLIFVGPFVLPYVLSSEYENITMIMALLAIGYGFNAVFLWTRPALVALGLISEHNIASFILAIITLSSLYIFVPQFGAVATASIMAGFFVAFSLAAFLIFLMNRKLLQDIKLK